MLGYLVKCAAVLIGLWLARYFQFLPWSTLVNILSTVVVPIALVAIGLWRGERARQQAEQESVDAALNAVERHLMRP